MKTTKEMREIGYTIRKAKGEKSYYEISKLSGVTPVGIKNIERGAHCSVFSLIQVCKALNLSISILIPVNN